MTQIDELLRQTANAVKRDDEAERRAISRAHRALSAAIAAAATHDLPQPRANGRRWALRLPRLLTGRGLALAGATGAAAAVAVALLAPGGNVIHPTPAAAAILRRAANAALAVTPPQLQPGQYWYEEDQATYLDTVQFANGADGTIQAYVSQDERYWIGAQHYVRRDRLESVEPAQPITSAAQRAALKEFEANPDISGSGGGYDLPVSYARMLQAPSDPAALADFIQHDHGAPPANQTPQQRATSLFLQITDILIEPRVPGQMLAGMYRLAATLEGVRVIGTVTDTLGRQALAIGFTDNDQQTTYELLFDPHTYALLDERNTNSVTGQLEENVAYRSTGTVASVGATPAQSQPTTQQQPTTTTPPSRGR